MMRRFLQMVLMLSLLGGSAVQALACDSLVEDSHPCCKALATIYKTTQSHLLKKTSHTSLKGGSCGCAAAPTRHQHTPAGSGAVQRNGGPSVQIEAPVEALPFHHCGVPAVRLCAANYDSPPPFILHHSLLI
jgi:hypothetical protein